MASGVDIWTPKDSIPLITSDSIILTQSFVATAGQTIFVLTQYSYVLNTGSVQVFKNGLKLALNTEWTETGTTTITLAVGATVGDIIDVVGYLSEVGGASSVAVINDAGVDSTVAWSAAKIITELATKEAADVAIQAHLSNVSNPHSVTQTQVGLSNVDNTSDLAKPISTATQSALDLKEAANVNIQAHIGTVTGNPHSVTKAEVGLSNADNTSDADKPVSTAQQTALDLKYAITAADAKFLHFPDAASPVIANVATRAVKFLGFDAAGELTYLGGGGSSTDAIFVAIADAGGYYTGGNVEAALQELNQTGTFTPTLQDLSESDAEGQTYIAQVGIYTRVGKLVFIEGNLVVNSIGTLSGAVTVAGLPFTSRVSSPPSGVLIHQGENLNIPVNTSLTGTIQPNTDRISLNIWKLTGGEGNMSAAEYSNLGVISFSGFYTVD